jgi:hypothetical protein
MTFSTVVIGDRLSLCSAPKSRESGGSREDNPVDPVTLSDSNRLYTRDIVKLDEE